MPLRWKVCGVTREQDARAAVAAGADAIGFVFWPASPRAVSVQEAARISAGLPAATWRFGVFVDAPEAEMATAVERVGLDFLQMAGDESPERCHGLVRHAFKVLRPTPAMDAAAVDALADRYPECTLLVDAAAGYGGSGVRADWNAAAVLAARHRLMLAGGLDADTVGDAVRAVRPWAVDVASGVESAPGIKDPHRLLAFARALEPFR